MKIKLKIQYVIICLFLLVQFLPMSASSEERKGEISISPMVGMYVFDHQQDIEKDLIGALGLGYNFTENWATEFMVNYGRFDHKYFDMGSCACEKEKIDGLVMHLDALYNFSPDKKLVPYLAAGIGGVMLDGDRLHDDYTAVNWGGGVKYFLNEDMALRADARHLYDLEKDNNNNASFTVGMTFQFGGEEKVVTPPPAPPVIPIEKVEAPPMKEKITIDLKVQFDFDKADIKPQYHDNIKKLADFMTKYPDIDAEIEGHTCSMGSTAYNKGLSQRRAESVKAYMIKNFGIDPARLTSVGYGESRPIADNNTRDGRIKNRRVHAIVSEEVVVEKPAPLQ